MSRRDFPRKVKAEAITRAAGRCERCSAVLKPGEAEVDHILEDALGGEPVLANAQVLCKPCHREKTAERIAKIRKADRARDKATGAVRPKNRLRNPPKQPKPARKPSLPPKILYRKATP